MDGVTTRERPAGAPRRNLYGRRGRGRKIRAGEARRLEELLRDLEPPGIGWAENPERRALDPSRLWPGKEIWLEIGFGGGEHMLATASRNPYVQIIGADYFVNGVGKLLATIDQAGIDNVSIIARDARDLMDVLPEGSIGRVYLLYPDPWPKPRHRKRRFIQPSQLDQLARIMETGAELRIATDIPVYLRHTVETMAADPRFACVRGAAGDWHEPWEHWPGTRYEAKALREGRTPHYLIFQRL